MIQFLAGLVAGAYVGGFIVMAFVGQGDNKLANAVRWPYWIVRAWLVS